MAEQVQPDTFNPLCHILRSSVESKLDALLKEYASQFAKNETSTGTTPLMEMTIDTGDSDPVSQKPYLIAMKNYQWVKDEIEKLLTAKVICSSRSSCSVPIIVVPKPKAIQNMHPPKTTQTGLCLPWLSRLLQKNSSKILP